jgi:hypothetical protein
MAPTYTPRCIRTGLTSLNCGCCKVTTEGRALSRLAGLAIRNLAECTTQEAVLGEEGVPWRRPTGV